MRNQSRLQSSVANIQSLYGERAEVNAAIAEEKAKLKSAGYSVKVINLVLTRMKMTAAEREEVDALVNIYEGELGLLNGTPLGSAALKRLEPKPKDPELPFGEDDSVPPRPTSDDQEDGEADVAATAEPEVTAEEARAQGLEAAQAGEPITANPHAPRSAARAAWEEGWLEGSNSDGMDIPDAWKATPRPKKGKPSGSDEQGGAPNTEDGADQ